MLNPNKSHLRQLAIVMLFLPIVTQAEPGEPSQEDSQLQIQMQLLKNQMTDANNRISILETALNTVNSDINPSPKSEVNNPGSSIQSGAENPVARRKVIGHARRYINSQGR